MVKDGKYTEYYDFSGREMLEFTYKDGMEEGLYTSWYNNWNGQKEYEVNWKDGKKDGLETYWDEEGDIIETKTYKDGNLVG